MNNPLEMQPTISLNLAMPADQAIGRMREAIRSDSLAGKAVSAGRCLDFAIEKQEQRFWSPHLTVQLSDVQDGSELFARFAPRPEVWTMVMFIYSMAACCAFGGAIYGYVQLQLGWTAWGFWIVPASLAIIGGLHFASLVGQRLSMDQMYILRQRLDQTLELAFPDDPVHTYD